MPTAGFWPLVFLMPQCRTASTLASALASMSCHVVAFAYQGASQETAQLGYYTHS